MRTLHLTNFWHTTSGGVATFYRALIEAANRRGHHLGLVVPSENDRIEQIGDFVRIYNLRAAPAPLNPHYRLLRPRLYLRPGGAIPRILHAEKPNLVEICDKYTLNYLAALLRKRLIPGLAFRPVVVGLSCERMDVNVAVYLGASRLSEFFARRYMKWLYFPMFDHHVAVSHSVAEELRAASRGHAVRRAVWIRGMGVDAELFHPRRRNQVCRLRLAAALGLPAEATWLLYAGRLVPEKNLELLADTLRELTGDAGTGFHLVVAGDGILRGELERDWTRAFGGRVHFLGHVSDRALLADLYANADMFLHPNPREPFGIAPLEAMASGTPLVAANSGGVTEYANAQNAWLAEPTAAAFARACLEALREPQLRRERTARARQTAEAHSWPRVAEGFLDLYRELWNLARNPAYPLVCPPAFHSTPGDWLGREIA
jgi:alpha-1,6-mannosyltransferase